MLPTEGRDMKIEMQAGQPIIDAKDLAGLLDLTPAEVQARMRTEDINTRFEIGEGEDAGRIRLRFLYTTKTVRLTCAEDGTVLTTVRTDTGGR